jgi:hypothetical protein
VLVSGPIILRYATGPLPQAATMRGASLS